MAKTFNEYALIPLAQYSTFKPILENDLGDVESKILDVLTQSNISSEEKKSKFLAILNENDPTLLNRNIEQSKPNSYNINSTDGEEQTSDFSHLSNCFKTEDNSARQEVSDPASGNITGLVADNINPKVVEDNKVPVSIEGPPRKKSILDSSQQLMKERLLSQVRSDLKKQGSDGSGIEDSKQEESVRKSSRKKKPTGWSKYY